MPFACRHLVRLHTVFFWFLTWVFSRGGVFFVGSCGSLWLSAHCAGNTDNHHHLERHLGLHWECKQPWQIAKAPCHCAALIFSACSSMHYYCCGVGVAKPSSRAFSYRWAASHCWLAAHAAFLCVLVRTTVRTQLDACAWPVLWARFYSSSCDSDASCDNTRVSIRHKESRKEDVRRNASFTLCRWRV